MESGYVLDFSDAKYGEFFGRHNVDIHGRKYEFYGTSKAKKLRAFWTLEPDGLVGRVLDEMLDSYATSCEIEGKPINRSVLDKARDIVGRLTRKPVASQRARAEDEFLSREFQTPDTQKLPVETQVISIIEERLNEARAAFDAGAHLAVVILCGSVLEAVLLGSAQKAPATFNRAKATPKTAGSPRPFHEWTLAQLIDVACEIGVLKPDDKKFSHGLRHFSQLYPSL